MPKLPLLFLLIFSATAAAQNGGVTATLSLAGPDKLTIKYDIPDSCQSLSFINNGMRDDEAAGMRADWTSSDACGVVDGRGVRRSGAACKSLQFTVPASDRKYDRVYAWAYPLGGGVGSHTSAFAVGSSCGPVSWQFAAPNGTIVLDGVRHAERAQGSGDIGYNPVIFLGAPLADGAKTRSYVNPLLSPATSAFATDTVSGAFDFYDRAMPGLDAAHGFVVVTKSENERSWGGEVANQNTVFLTLPLAIASEMKSSVRGFVAHEVVHMFQPRDMHDAWADDHAMIAEGGADFLRWMALAQMAWADDAYLKQNMENAINKCVIASKGKQWRAVPERGWGKTPYNCGQAFHALGLASRSATAPALIVMRDYYLAGRKGGPTDFSTALECGGKAGCDARWLNRIAGAEPVGAVLSAYARTGGFLKVADGSAPTLVEPMMRDVFAQLMRIDCKGETSIYENPGEERIGKIAGRCKVLREGMTIVAAEGQPLFAGPAGTQAVLAACSGRGLARLGLKDGSSIELDCSATNVQAPVELFEVDMGVLRKRLGII